MKKTLITNKRIYLILSFLITGITIYFFSGCNSSRSNIKKIIVENNDTTAIIGYIIDRIIYNNAQITPTSAVSSDTFVVLYNKILDGHLSEKFKYEFLTNAELCYFTTQFYDKKSGDFNLSFLSLDSFIKVNDTKYVVQIGRHCLSPLTDKNGNIYKDTCDCEYEKYCNHVIGFTFNKNGSVLSVVHKFETTW